MLCEYIGRIQLGGSFFIEDAEPLKSTQSQMNNSVKMVRFWLNIKST